MYDTVMYMVKIISSAPFEVDGQTVYLPGALTSVVANNLASNLIGGFKSLSSAFRKCRHCLATAEEIQTKVIIYNNCIYNILIPYVCSYSQG